MVICSRIWVWLRAHEKRAPPPHVGSEPPRRDQPGLIEVRGLNGKHTLSMLFEHLVPNSNTYCIFHMIEQLWVTGLGSPRSLQTVISIVIFIWLSSLCVTGLGRPKSRRTAICIAFYVWLSSRCNEFDMILRPWEAANARQCSDIGMILGMRRQQMRDNTTRFIWFWDLGSSKCRTVLRFWCVFTTSEGAS